ncbi:HipA N-terminal domain-containing protein [bacterium]|nr:HipA N-terminal domain-containing protein [bacterium]
MRKAKVYMQNQLAGTLIELKKNQRYRFSYLDGYEGPAISLTMPANQKDYDFTGFPPFFDGLLPEGFQLEALLRKRKIDRNDLFSQLITVGQDLVGAVTVVEEK